MKKLFKYLLVLTIFLPVISQAEESRLLRQPSISDNNITFVYGGDIWLSDLNGQQVRRVTSTSAVESDPHFSPDGKVIAFTSNRSGTSSVYTVSLDGSDIKRLTWHAKSAYARGWTPDGQSVLYASARETAPKSYHRLWTVPRDGGVSQLVSEQWAYNGSFAESGKQLVIDRMSRWDVEWRNYRGGQNTPLVLLDLTTLNETQIPSDSTIDIEPVWAGDTVYFLSDRDWVSNVWSYTPKNHQIKQITHFKKSDIKQLASNGKLLAFEQNGYLHTYDVKSKKHQQLNIQIYGDFPWAETKWQDVSKSASEASLSPTGKRALFSSRGEIFTVPVEHGSTRNLTQSSDTADRAPLWSPQGDKIAWFSDQGEKGYRLMLQDQDGLSAAKAISIGESKMAWEPTWSPDGKFIAFVDDDVRIRLLDLTSEKIITVDVGGNNLERGDSGLVWSPDSKWLAYSKTANNSFRQIMIWSTDNNKVMPLTNKFADSISPSWDKSGKHIYFLASTDYGLKSGWANTSTIGAKSEYAAYIVNLTTGEDSPFIARSDEEKVTEPEHNKDKSSDNSDENENKNKTESIAPVVIDFKDIERRIIALPIPAADYEFTINGPEGSVFIAESNKKNRSFKLHKFSVKDRKSSLFISDVTSAKISADTKSLLVKIKKSWHILDTGKEEAKPEKALNVSLKMKLDRLQEWRQMFVEAWRYQRDYFYDPNMHGRDWNEVFARYEPQVAHIRHRSDLTYLLDQVNGELSVGHSFVFGGDYPEVEKSTAGLLGANFSPSKKHWKIDRIFTTESWNPKLRGPLDQPGMKVENGHYLVGINGQEVSSHDNLYQYLDGTLGQQTVLYINETDNFKDSWQVIVEPIANEDSLRQRAWVEDNRRLVDQLSGGKLAYVWVPNTSTPGFVSFNRYFFAQQDKQGAVIDERFNGGGLLDDYMVDLLTRKLRASLTNEVPDGQPLQLPAGIKGPKVLLINELAGSGGDYFPWAFRQQKVGKLIGAKTWGGLVKSSVHYRLVDGGALTAPDNAVFDPIANEWVGENKGIAPDINVYQDAKSLAEGKDPQLERAVIELLEQLEGRSSKVITPPKFSTPALKP
ncbi:S41 family peptidase [Thalassotalea profundi]|uniref:Tricorn protease homolog n=1 Tax=Thalassotalea profundi TaxID=2036687 RepID=A0ABQ3IGT1_9GAMM|nr:S41 family peptidase [Thalassotalea profundi]GHE83969.1 tricorn protease [Thalassotalea profundi]